MLEFYQTCGIYSFPLTLLAIGIVVLVAKKSIDLFFRPGLPAPERARGLHAILFWGCVAALLGVLGQLTGMYNALGAIVSATQISPALILVGLRESITTTLFGLTILFFAAVAWFVLRTRYKSGILRSGAARTAVSEKAR